MRHLLTMDDVTRDEINDILSAASELKEQFQRGLRPPKLANRVLGLVFSKPSLRTRVSFEAGMSQLGGTSLYLGQDVGWQTRETVADFARVISQYVDILVCREHAHRTVEELARHANCPVINGLTDLAHPCQALADVFTLRELKGGPRPLKLAFVGDGNNVSRSLAIACSKLGISFALATPKSYQLEHSLIERLRRENPGCQLLQTSDPREALQDATAVYTDVWSSMGFEAEADRRNRDFSAYQVDAQMMSLAPNDAVFMHCLPAHRGQEVTDEVIDSPQSIVVKQAANRMHLEKGLLTWLLEHECD
jgi:ornithine carbamoyltransferase